MKGAYIMPSITLAITPAVGIAIVVFLIIAVMIVGITIRASSEADMLPEPVLCTKKVLEGELIGMKRDQSGMTRITVKGDDGEVYYGFVTHAVEDLEYLYEEKNYIQIALSEPPTGRAYMVNTDYWDGDKK